MIQEVKKILKKKKKYNLKKNYKRVSFKKHIKIEKIKLDKRFPIHKRSFLLNLIKSQFINLSYWKKKSVLSEELRMNKGKKPLYEFPDILTEDYENYADDVDIAEEMDEESSAKKRKCIFYVRSKYSNYFITVTDIEGRVLVSSSLGQVSYSYNKKKKMSHLLVYSMMNRVVRVLRFKRIKNIIFIFKSKINRHTFNVISFLEKGKFFFSDFFFLKPIAHHSGQRKKKPRRI